MKHTLISPSPALVAAGLFVSAVGTSPAQDLDENERSGWFVRADAVARFNVKASVKELPLSHEGPGIYDNGFVLPDVGGTASGLTWNWGYQSAGQVAYDANNQPQAIVFSRLENFPTVSGDVKFSNPILEGEVVGGYHFDDFKIGKRRARLGFEVGYGYFASSQAMNFQAAGNAARTIDTYGLGGVVPPVAPYAGTFFGPGPLLNLNPDPANSGVNVFYSTTTFQGTFDTTFHNFRVGPSFSIDLTRRFTVQVGAGYDSLYALAEVSYLETSAHTPNPGTVSLKENKWRPGIYAEILLNCALTRRLQIFAGGDFQLNNDMSFSDGRHEYTLELGSTYAAKGGVSYSF